MCRFHNSGEGKATGRTIARPVEHTVSGAGAALSAQHHDLRMSYINSHNYIRVCSVSVKTTSCRMNQIIPIKHVTCRNTHAGFAWTDGSYMMQRSTYAGCLVPLDDAAPPEPPASPVLSQSGGGLLPESRPLVYGDPTGTLVYPNRVCKQYHTRRNS